MNIKATKKDKADKQAQAKASVRGKSKTEEITRSLKKAKDEKPKKAKKSKERENGVKRARSAYNFFCEEQRSKIVKDNPGVKPTDVMKLLGNLWKDISEDQKKKYEELAAKDKDRYQKEKDDSDGDSHGKKEKKVTRSNFLLNFRASQY
jgi:structure-specific recognition protein 1